MLLAITVAIPFSVHLLQQVAVVAQKGVMELLLNLAAQVAAVAAVTQDRLLEALAPRIKDMPEETVVGTWVTLPVVVEAGLVRLVQHRQVIQCQGAAATVLQVL